MMMSTVICCRRCTMMMLLGQDPSFRYGRSVRKITTAAAYSYLQDYLRPSQFESHLPTPLSSLISTCSNKLAPGQLILAVLLPVVQIDPIVGSPLSLSQCSWLLLQREMLFWLLASTVERRQSIEDSIQKNGELPLQERRRSTTMGILHFEDQSIIALHHCIVCCFMWVYVKGLP